MVTYAWITLILTNRTAMGAESKVNLLYTNHMLAYCEIRCVPSSQKKERNRGGYHCI